MKECAKCGKIESEIGMVDVEDTVLELTYCRKCTNLMKSDKK